MLDLKDRAILRGLEFSESNPDTKSFGRHFVRLIQRLFCRFYKKGLVLDGVMLVDDLNKSLTRCFYLFIVDITWIYSGLKKDNISRCLIC